MLTDGARWSKQTYVSTETKHAPKLSNKVHNHLLDRGCRGTERELLPKGRTRAARRGHTAAASA